MYSSINRRSPWRKVGESPLFGPVAQLGAHYIRIVGVGSSNLLGSTTSEQGPLCSDVFLCPWQKKDAIARSLASPFRIEPAGLRFVFLSAILGIFSVNDLCPESLIVWAFLFFDFLPFQVLAAWLHLPQRYVLFSVCDSVHTAGRKASSKTLKTDLSHCRRGLSWAGIYFPFVARYTKNRRNKRQNLSFACMLKCVACGNGQFRL